ncbi:MAG TPA: hypothetical protein DDW33_06340 [Ktedonobacter sp.]|jgi:hypothetical protein|nr:hypothetical protein [Ktedonobacter sp.]HAG98042.1 hypothetical protein [Ktedonobacter sp.]HAT44573.1 hypothetical protein [Ktedonobacter sp.]HBE25287.1 hypothetical protein [Ktedonobacter sp.]HBE27252.1 hypothetical protein [Ktedonobacter sp.]
MSAMSSAVAQPAMVAGQDRAKRMSSTMHGMCMAAASIIIIGTGVFTSVSLVARMLTLLLVVLGILNLSGLTGLGGLVGLITGLTQSISQGD